MNEPKEYLDLEGVKVLIEAIKGNYPRCLLQVKTMPVPTEKLVGAILQYIGETTEDYHNGYIYKCVFEDNRYQWVVSTSSESQFNSPDNITIEIVDGVIKVKNGGIDEDKLEATLKNFILSREEKFRFLTMPEAKESLKNKIYQYVGLNDTEDFKVGDFYKCQKVNNVWTWVHLMYTPTASEIKCNNTKSVQHNLERIDKRIDKIVDKGTSFPIGTEENPLEDNQRFLLTEDTIIDDVIYIKGAYYYDQENERWVLYANVSNSNAFIVHSVANETIEGFGVPSLTSQNVIDLYNNFKIGKVCMVVNKFETQYLRVTEAENFDVERGREIKIVFQDKLILFYDENGMVTGTLINSNI